MARISFEEGGLTMQADYASYATTREIFKQFANVDGVDVESQTWRQVRNETMMAGSTILRKLSEDGLVDLKAVYDFYGGHNGD